MLVIMSLAVNTVTRCPVSGLGPTQPRPGGVRGVIFSGYTIYEGPFSADVKLTMLVE